MRRLFLSLLLLFACACDRPEPSVPVIPTPVETGPNLHVDFQPITPLTPNRMTHVAVDSLGNVCWLQENQTGDDTLFIMGEGQIPRITDLTASRVAEAVAGKGAKGRIQSIAAAPRNGELYLYFLGGKGKQLLAALAIYTPKTGRTRIVADADLLKSASGLGPSLALARGTLYTNASTLWLWIRHTDDSALFRIRHVDIPAAGSPRLSESLLTVTIEEQKVPLTDDDYNFAPAGEDSLFWVDIDESELRQIDRIGRATTVRSLIGLPVALSAPVRNTDGRFIMFAGDSPLMEPQHIGHVDSQRVRLSVNKPAIVLLPAGQGPIRAVSRENFSIYSGFPLSNMRLSQLLPEPKQSAWIAYDVSSGELLRMRLRDKTAPLP